MSLLTFLLRAAQKHKDLKHSKSWTLDNRIGGLKDFASYFPSLLLENERFPSDCAGCEVNSGQLQ